MILQIRCTKCNGKVIEREGLDGEEKLCLNCGFGQIANVIPDEALAKDSEDHQVRNRGNGWIDSYADLRSPYTIRKDRGQRTNWRKKKQKVTKETIETWNRIKEELTSQEVNKGSNK